MLYTPLAPTSSIIRPLSIHVRTQRTTPLITGLAQRCLLGNRLRLPFLRCYSSLSYPFWEARRATRWRPRSPLPAGSATRPSGDGAPLPTLNVPRVYASQLAAKAKPHDPKERQLCFERVFSDCLKGNWPSIDQHHPGQLSSLRDKWGRSLLIAAVEEGGEGLVDELIQRDIAVAATDSDGNTPLHIAAANGLGRIIRCLKPRYSSDINRHKETALHVAIANGHNHCVDLLLRDGCDVKATVPWKGGSPLDPLALSVATGHVNCLKEVFKHSKTPQFDQIIPGVGTLLHLAIFHQQNRMLKVLCNDYTNQTDPLLERRDHTGCSPLSLACYLGDLEAVTFLIKDKNVSAGSVDDQGRTAVYWAISGKSPEVLRLLSYYDVPLSNLASDARSPLAAIEQDTSSQANLTRDTFKALLQCQQQDLPSVVAPENIVFSGGGPKGIVHIGGLRALEEKGLLGQSRRYAGTSSGALVASFLATGAQPQQLEEILTNLNLETLLDPLPEWEHLFEKGMEVVRGETTIGVAALKAFAPEWAQRCLDSGRPLQSAKEVMNKLLDLDGLCSGERYREWIEERIAENTRISYCTFGELEQLVRQNPGRYRHLKTYTTQIIYGALPKLVSYSSEYDLHHRDVVLSDVIRASGGYPGLFRPHTIHYKDGRGRRYPRSDLGVFLDGGFVKNFPIDAFDQNRYQRTGGIPDDETSNRRTLGFRVQTQLQPNTPETSRAWELIRAIGKIYYNAENTLFKKSAHKKRTIELPVTIQTLNFELSQQQKKELVEVGRKATCDSEFLNRFIRNGALPPPRVRLKAYLRRGLDDFSGRQAQLDSLNRLLSPDDLSESTRVHLIFGLGGMGKSLLSRKFAFDNLHRFSEIWTVECRTREQQKQSYEEIAKTLKLSLREGTELKQLCRQVHCYIENNDYDRPWLMILDNFESPLIEDCDYPKRGGIVLTTSRSSSTWDRPDHQTHLSVFSPTEARSLVSKVVSEDESQEMEELVRNLGFFPLALHQAARFIRGTEGSISEYLKAFPTLAENPRAGDYQPDPNDLYQYTLKTVWTQTFHLLQKEYPDTLEWLTLCAHLNPDGIPQQWLESLFQPSSRQTYKAKALGVRAALNRFALMDLSEKGFSIHSILQDAIRHHREETTHESEGGGWNQATKFVENQRQLLESEKGKEIANLTLGPQVLWVVERSLSHLEREEKRKMLDVAESIYFLYGKHANAIESSKKALNIAQDLHSGKDHSDIVNALNDVADNLPNLGQYQEALKYSIDALNMCQRLHDGKDHSDMVRTLDVYGWNLGHLGRFQEARENLNNALKMNKRLHGPDVISRSLGNTYNNLGWIQAQLGHYREAINQNMSALDIFQRLHPDSDHPDIARSLNNIGWNLGHLNPDTKALDYSTKALEMRQRLFEEKDHPLTAGSLHNRGTNLARLGRYKEALTDTTEALDIRESLYQGDHPYISGSQNNIGIYYRKLKRYDDALDYGKRSLKMSRRLYENNHPDIATGLNNVGIHYSQLGELLQAEKHINDSLTMFRALYKNENPTHPYLAGSLNNLGRIQSKLGKHDKAIKHGEEALEILESAYNGKDHPDLVICLTNVSSCLRAKGDQKRDSYIARAIQTLQRLSNSEDSDHQKTDQYSNRAIQMLERLYNEKDCSYTTEEDFLLHFR